MLLYGTVQKVPLPPTEKAQGGPTLSHTRPAPSSTLSPRSGCYVQVWGVDRWPPRVRESRVYFASLTSLSRFWLIAFLHKMHIQKFFDDLIDGSCTHRPGYVALRCLPEPPTTNPALLAAVSPSTHPGISAFGVLLCLEHLSPFVPPTFARL